MHMTKSKTTLYTQMNLSVFQIFQIASQNREIRSSNIASIPRVYIYTSEPEHPKKGAKGGQQIHTLAHSHNQARTLAKNAERAGCVLYTCACAVTTKNDVMPLMVARVSSCGRAEPRVEVCLFLTRIYTGTHLCVQHTYTQAKELPFLWLLLALER